MKKINKPQLHVSALNMLFRCGEQFRRRYIENEVIPPGIALIIGRATDHTVTMNLRNKKDKKELLPLEQISDTARDAVVNEFHGKIKLTDEEAEKGIRKVKGETIDTTIQLSILHATETAPIIRPTHVQWPWVIDLDGFPFSIAGTMDIREGYRSIRDTKTSKKTPPKDVAEKSLQLTMYAMALWVLKKKTPQRVWLDYLIRKKNIEARSFFDVKTETDFRMLIRRIEIAAEAIEKESFVPVNPDHWVCDPRYCGYYDTCKYSGR